MNALPGFELRARDGEGQRSELIDPSGQPRAALDGAVLEAVYQLGDGYLVVSVDGDAFEECLHLTLCDPAFAAREVIHLGGAYQTGRFRAHAPFATVSIPELELDVDSDTDLERLSARLGPRTRALLAVHA